MLGTPVMLETQGCWGHQACGDVRDMGVVGTWGPGDAGDTRDAGMSGTLGMPWTLGTLVMLGMQGCWGHWGQQGCRTWGHGTWVAAELGGQQLAEGVEDAGVGDDEGGEDLHLLLARPLLHHHPWEAWGG